MKCPICDEENSEYAYECFKCGFSIRERPSQIMRWLKVGSVIMILAVVAYFLVPVLTDKINLYYLRIDGDRLLSEANFPKAAEAYSAAIKLDSKSAHLYSQRAASYAGIKEYQKAELDYTNAIQIDPGNKNYYYQRGVINIELGQKEAAKKDLEVALRMGIQEAQALLGQLDASSNPVR